MDFSVNPRLLLAVLEYRNGWLTVYDNHIETGSGQIIGAGSTNNAATQYHNSQIYIPHRGQPQTFIVQSEDERSIRSIG